MNMHIYYKESVTFVFSFLGLNLVYGEAFKVMFRPFRWIYS